MIIKSCQKSDKNSHILKNTYNSHKILIVNHNHNSDSFISEKVELRLLIFNWLNYAYSPFKSKSCR
jgi:hypothetical protein